MVKIKLTRLGRKGNPFYRIVIANAKEKRETDFIEYVGSYSPLTKDLKLQDERIQYWLSVGAQPTETVRGLLVRNKLMNPLKKKPYKKEPGKKKKEQSKK